MTSSHTIFASRSLFFSLSSPSLPPFHHSYSLFADSVHRLVRVVAKLGQLHARIEVNAPRQLLLKANVRRLLIQAKPGRWMMEERATEGGEEGREGG